MSSIPNLPFEHVKIASNVDFYDSWAAQYDQSNPLQRVDDKLFEDNVLPRIAFLPRSQPVHIMDLGCGTGRNTTKLVPLLPPGSRITGVEQSEAMLNIAKPKFMENRSVNFIRSSLEALEVTEDEKVDALISTLVLEHVPLAPFFQVAARVLKSGGWAWVTSMHPDLGSQGQASFTNEEGKKVVGVSWNHTPEATIAAAEQEGLFLEGEVVIGRGGEKEKEKWQDVKMGVGFLFIKI